MNQFDTLWPYILAGVLLAMMLFCILDYSQYKVYGDIPIEKKITELQWRIEDLEEQMRING